MTRPLLVLRPEPGNRRTAAAARALGLAAITAPLFTVRPVAWQADDVPEAILMTSANAARHGGGQLAALTDRPLYAVGTATAETARAAGFSDIRIGEGNVEAVLALAAADGVSALLHLAGRDHRAAERPGLRITRRIVYASDAVDSLPAPARDALPGAVALLHSARAAAVFARLVEPAHTRIAALSPAVLAAAGTGWAAAATADLPTDACLLAVAAKLCDQGA